MPIQIINSVGLKSRNIVNSVLVVPMIIILLIIS